SRRISLRDLALARFDSRVVLRVRALRSGAGPGDSGANRDWRPPPLMLWKGISFSSFDPQLESWAEETEYRQQNWPAEGSLKRTQPALAANAKPILLHQIVVTPVLRNLVLPYFTGEIQAKQFAMYRESTLDDILPSPKLAQDTEYSTLVFP